MESFDDMQKEDVREQLRDHFLENGERAVLADLAKTLALFNLDSRESWVDEATSILAASAGCIKSREVTGCT